MLGPLAITSLRESASREAINRLVARLDPQLFEQSFGAGVAELDLLVQKKTLTISKLMAIAPPGTPDPTSGLYNSTMFLMAALLAVALLANAWIRPVAPRHYIDAHEAR